MREASISIPASSLPERCVLVIGGAPEHVTAWEESRLVARVQDLCHQGLSAKEIGRELARETGWPRRDIYRLAVDSAQPPADK